MNSKEKQMLSILKELAETSGAVSVKAEFEAEGTRTEELLRLLEIARKADLGIALKIGGCEAIRDLIEAKQFGVDYIIAPMVETAYALQKFIEAKNKVYDQEEQEDVDFLVNIETITGFNNREHIVAQASTKGGIQGLVFGRVDYVGSCGLPRDSVDEPNIVEACKAVGGLCKDLDLDLVVGGGVSINAIGPLSEIRETHLSRFETRKIIFDANSLGTEGLKKGLLNAVHFELLWLLNKREYYNLITKEDDKRIEMLDSRWKLLNKN